MRTELSIMDIVGLGASAFLAPVVMRVLIDCEAEIFRINQRMIDHNPNNYSYQDPARTFFTSVTNRRKLEREQLTLSLNLCLFFLFQAAVSMVWMQVPDAFPSRSSLPTFLFWIPPATAAAAIVIADTAKKGEVTLQL